MEPMLKIPTYMHTVGTYLSKVPREYVCRRRYIPSWVMLPKFLI